MAARVGGQRPQRALDGAGHLGGALDGRRLARPQPRLEIVGLGDGTFTAKRQ